MKQLVGTPTRYLPKLYVYLVTWLMKQNVIINDINFIQFRCRFGRKSTVIISSIMSSIFGMLRGLSTSYYMFLVFEFMDSFFGCAIYSTAYVLGKLICFIFNYLECCFLEGWLFTLLNPNTC